MENISFELLPLWANSPMTIASINVDTQLTANIVTYPATMAARPNSHFFRIFFLKMIKNIAAIRIGHNAETQ